MANDWFETVAEAQRRSKRMLPPSVYGALIAGTEKGITYQDNMNAFSELGFPPHVAGHSAERDMSTTIMGFPLSFPVMISPTGVQAVHPDGEVAVARAAQNRGITMGLSSFASKPIEEVAAVNDKTFFQMYWTGGRDKIEARMERAKAAGAKGLIATLDWSFSFGRDWGSPWIPEKLDLVSAMKFSPQALTHPAWLLRFLRKFTLPDLSTPNLLVAGMDKTPTFFGAYGEWMQTPPPSWDDIVWMKETWGGPFMLKGITRIDDAKRAVDAGVNAISVSNHGGNNLDTTPASVRALGPVVDAVGDQVEIVMDGGIRRGMDVAKALALGARAVMIGRAYLWGLGANGQAGVENVLDLLRSGLDATLLGLGKKSISELSREDLIIPGDFMRVMGDTAGAPAPEPKPARTRPARQTKPETVAAADERSA